MVVPCLNYGLFWALAPGMTLLMHGVMAFALAAALLAFVLKRVGPERLA